MNTPNKQAYFAPPLSGQLIGKAYQHTDTLFLDLYGALPDEDDEHYTVESVTLVGGTVDIVELFTRSQLDNMGKYLTFKDDTNPTMRSFAADCKHEAMQGPFEKRRGAY